jgi:NAD(P)-dependent dehydrogenase (short-subunit alcohol dehydrogenase family)
MAAHLTPASSRHYIPGGSPEWPADKIEALMADHCPLKRCATPEDVARVVAFLASDDGGWVNGTFHSRKVILRPLTVL